MNDQHTNPTLPSYLRPGLVDEILPALAMWDAETALILAGSMLETNTDDNTFQHKEIN